MQLCVYTNLIYQSRHRFCITLLQDLQFIATNLHTQIWSVSGSTSSDNGTQATSPTATATANSKTGISHYDFTTTGAPAGNTHMFTSQIHISPLEILA
jgi:hypothetical protein